MQDLGVLRVGAPEPRAIEADEAPQRSVEDQLQHLRESLTGLVGLLDQEDTPVQIVARAIGDNVLDAARHAKTILHAYGNLGSSQHILTPFAGLSDDPEGFGASLGFDAKNLALSGSQLIDLMVVFLMGAIGSLIYITQYLLSRVIKGKSLSFGAGKSFAWFVFRPIFGVVIAFAIYLIYKAGQIALGAGTATTLSSEVNLPILSTVSLFAGLLSWQVLGLIEERGSRMFSSARRVPMWAVGLENALVARGIDNTELAGHLGITDTQVQRWIDLVDQVTPEMQDRIAAWLDILPIEVFSTRNGDIGLNKRYAYCLDRIIRDGGLDRLKIADQLKVPPEILLSWARTENRKPVPPKYQHALVKALDTDVESLFCPRAKATPQQPATGDEAPEDSTPDEVGVAGEAPRDEPRSNEPEPVVPSDDFIEPDQDEPPEMDTKALWAIGLREALQDYEEGSSAHLAAVLELDQKNVREWMELDSAVPQQLQESLVVELETDASLFAEAKPSEMMVISNRAVFLTALDAHPRFDDESVEERLAIFADIIDADLERLKAWLDGERPMAAATAKRLLFELGDSADSEFLVET